MPTQPITLAVLASGSGTTLQNILDRISDGSLNAKVSIFIASRSGIKAIDRAKNAGIPTCILQRKEFPFLESFSEKIFKTIESHNADLTCLAGYLSQLIIPIAWTGKVMNIHPALLPSFGGKGMFGHHVHQGVLDYGCKVSGCTVHYVNNDYDAGPIILQRTCPAYNTDTADTLAHRVFEEEKIAYPEAIRLHQTGKLRIEGRKVIID
jgi:phosphoribosylglycinamide formyltransferase 1